MDVDMTWLRKRPIEEEEYQQKKRYLSEQFFNLRISQKSASTSALGHVSGHMPGASANGVDVDDENMDEARNSSTNAPQPISMNISRQLDNGGDGEGAGGGLGTDEDDSDVGESPAPFLSRRDKKPHLPHPFKRSVSSPVDEKVEDLLRTSRHRLLADASVGVTPGQCRAITVYNPVLLPGGVATGGEGETSCDSDGEAGGDPTPSPGATGNDGDKRAAVSSSCSSCSSGSPPASSLNTARVCSAAGGAGMGMLQCAGSGTAEGVRSGSCGGDRSQGHSGDRDFFSGGGGGGSGGGPRGLQTGGGLAHSAADVAAGPMTDDNDEIGDGGAAASLLTSTAGALIAVTTANDAMEDDDIMGTLPGISNQPALTRMGTSRGAPTPEITPEWVALARAASSKSIQEPGEGAANPGLPMQSTEGWGCW